MEKIILYEGKYIRLIRKGTWEYIERTKAAGVVVIVPFINGKTIFVEQLRVPLNKNVIEFPAGLVGDEKEFEGEDFAVAAARELEEETGFRANKIEFLCEGPTSAGKFNGSISMFLATELTKVSDGGGDENEDITVHEVELSKVQEFLDFQKSLGKLVDPKVYIGMYFIEKKLLC